MGRKKTKKAVAASSSSSEASSDDASAASEDVIVPAAVALRDRWESAGCGVADMDLTEDQLGQIKELKERVIALCKERDAEDKKEEGGKDETNDDSADSSAGAGAGAAKELRLGPVGLRYLADEDTMRRYLVAREWKMAEAEKLLVGTLEWFQTQSLFVLLKEPEVVASLSLEGETGKTYRRGKDKLGRPIIYMRDRNQNTKNYDDQVRFTHYVCQMAVESMDTDKGVRQWVIIVDFNGQSMSNRPPMKTVKDVLNIMMERFPERLGLMVMVDAGMILNMVWKVVAPMVPEETKAKVRFIKGSREHKREALKDIIDPAVLEYDFGGDATGEYEHEPYWAATVGDHEKLMAQYEAFTPGSKKKSSNKKSKSKRKKGGKKR